MELIRVRLIQAHFSRRPDRYLSINWQGLHTVHANGNITGAPKTCKHLLIIINNILFPMPSAPTEGVPNFAPFMTLFF